MLAAHNLLSASRLVATPVVGALVVVGGEGARLAALILAVAVALTDFVDGPLARRCGGASAFGALLDMTSDKVFLCSMLIVLAAVGEAPVWAAAIISSRELLVLALRVVAAGRAKPLAIATFGKLKTFMLYFLVPLALADAPWQAVWFLALAASVSACGSLIEYVVRMRSDLAGEFLSAPATRRDT